MTGTRSWQDSSPCNSATSADISDPQPLCNSSSKTNTDSELSSGKKRDSTANYSVWSSTSFKGMTPSSPSPKCSSFSQVSNSSPGSLASDFFHPQIFFPIPRHKKDRGSDDCKKSTSSSEEIEEKRITLNIHRDLKGKETVEEESNLTTAKCLSHTSSDAEQPNVGLPLGLSAVVANEGEIEEEMKDFEEKTFLGKTISSNTVCEFSESPSVRQRKKSISSRPRSYRAYLDEVEKKQLEDKCTTLQERERSKLMDKLRRKEAGIKAWEEKQTKKATLEMKKTEAKLEKKRAKAMREMEKKTARTNKKAEEKKAKERRATAKKISVMTCVADKIKATHSGVLVKCLSFF